MLMEREQEEESLYEPGKKRKEKKRNNIFPFKLRLKLQFHAVTGERNSCIEYFENVQIRAEIFAEKEIRYSEDSIFISRKYCKLY